MVSPISCSTDKRVTRRHEVGNADRSAATTPSLRGRTATRLPAPRQLARIHAVRSADNDQLIIRCAAHHAHVDDVPMSPPPVPGFTPKQGQYLAFIYAYTRVLGRPPAEADLQRHFGVSPPSVHQMVLTLERAGLIRRQPGVARSIEVLVAPELLPVLR
jgi:hypothetical protein